MKRALRQILSISIFLLIVLGVAYLVLNIFFIKTEVEGESMEPILSQGDMILSSRLTYNFNPPERNDVAVIQLADGTLIVKRVVGLPGETIKVNGFGKITLNNQQFDNDKGVGIIMKPGDLKKGVTLGMEEFYVLGDNRNNSIDSRNEEIGIIKRSQFVGKVVFRVLPANKFGKLDL